jgi:hypothetical protein
MMEKLLQSSLNPTRMAPEAWVSQDRSWLHLTALIDSAKVVLVQRGDTELREAKNQLSV